MIEALGGVWEKVSHSRRYLTENRGGVNENPPSGRWKHQSGFTHTISSHKPLKDQSANKQPPATKGSRRLGQN